LRVTRLAGSLAIVGFAARASAQRVTSALDLSGTNVWYADSLRSGGASVSPSLRVDWTRATLNASADIARLAGQGLSAQGAIAPSVFTPSFGSLVGELTGSAGGSTHADGSHTGQALASARAYAMRGRGGLWVGAGGGGTWDGVVWRDVRQAEGGAWFEQAGMMTLASVAPVAVQDTIRYTDVQAAWRYPLGSYELGATAGVRAGSVGTAVGGSSRAWGSVSVVAWFARGMAIVASGGSYPVDFTQGYPGGHFVTVALRVGMRPPQAAPATAPGGAPENSSSAVGANAKSFDVRTTAKGRELRVYAPAARSIEINADFTSWQPVSLARGDDGWWTVTRAVAVGTYQINLRVDGGPWVAPPGLLTTKDEFGGVVGILTIE
jgi:hypothetical protein